jgi:hypothetical protein
MIISHSGAWQCAAIIAWSSEKVGREKAQKAQNGEILAPLALLRG